jgi:beta-glucosidase
MPWRDKVAAIVQAWYPGQAGGRAIAEILTGAVNPSGHLPVTFPAALEQTPRPTLDGLGTAWGTPTTVRYDEGSDVGYRWFAKTDATPLYPFGHGLSYTTFAYGDLDVTGGDTICASFTVTNTGDRAGATVPQLYLTHVDRTPRARLLGFDRVELQPGESRRVSMEADPRVIARYDTAAGHWVLDPGAYRVVVARSAGSEEAAAEVEMEGRSFGR